MALLADAREDCTTARGVTRLRTPRPIDSFVAFNLLLLVRATLTDHAINLLQFGVDVSILQITQLAEDLGCQRVSGNGSPRHCRQHWLGERDPGGERVERIALFRTLQRIVGRQYRRWCFRIVIRRQSANRHAAEFSLVEQLLQQGRESGVFRVE